jgi:hypothetical protein
MVKPKLVLVAALSMSALALAAAQAPQERARVSAKAPALTTTDYIEIQQLSRRFAWAIDGGDNFGYAFADLFTPDGVYTDTSDGPNGKTTQGRDNLALVARGGQRGPLFLNHFGMNHVITPTADGARGKAYVAILDLAKRPHSVTSGGYYDDVYEKTALGWRFKTRTFHQSKVDFWPQPAATQ